MGKSVNKEERSSYVIRHSLWRNLVPAIIFLAVSSVTLLNAWERSHQDGTLVAILVFFGVVGFACAFSAFDRRIKISADHQGIQDFRSNYGLIAWSDIESVKTRVVRRGCHMTIYFRDPGKWLPRAPRWTQWMVSTIGMKFVASISLTNMDMDRRQFTRFVDRKIAESLGASISRQMVERSAAPEST